MKKKKRRNFSHGRGKTNIYINLTKDRFLLLAAVAVFLVIQFLLYSLNFNKLFINDIEGCSWIEENKEKLTGDIFFTGDTFGKYGLIGCDRLGSISRRAEVLKKFEDYLYLDFGNFTIDNPRINKASLPILLKAYQYMDLKVMNLTKRDLLNLAETNFDIRKIRGIHFLSANLYMNAPYLLINSNENNLEQGKFGSTYQLIPFHLKNNEEIQQILVGITGISNNELKGPSGFFPAIFGINIDGKRIYVWTCQQDPEKKYLVDVYDQDFKHLCTTSYYNEIGNNQVFIKNQRFYIPNIGHDNVDYKRSIGRFSVFNIPNMINVYQISRSIAND